MGLDQDLFQTIALALGVISLLLLLLLLSMLGKIRKLLEEAGRDTSALGSSAPSQTSSAYSAPDTSASAAPAATSQTYTPAAQTSTPVSQTPAAQSATPVSQTSTPAAQTSAPGAASAAPAAAASEPQDQPFERDGRWWYRRGDELLVYDEGSGQWVPAPAGAGAGEAASTGFTPVGGTGGGTTQQLDPAIAAADAGGWKCPSCGAINGATASSCRMCFTPRA